MVHHGVVHIRVMGIHRRHFLRASLRQGVFLHRHRAIRHPRRVIRHPAHLLQVQDVSEAVIIVSVQAIYSALWNINSLASIIFLSRAFKVID